MTIWAGLCSDVEAPGLEAMVSGCNWGGASPLEKKVEMAASPVKLKRRPEPNAHAGGGMAAGGAVA